MIYFLIILILVVIIGGAYNRNKGIENIRLIANEVIGMDQAKARSFINKEGCDYVILQKDNINRMEPYYSDKPIIKLYIRNDVIKNATVG